jgi:purine-binding chemotaxis protein CheW
VPVIDLARLWGLGERPTTRWSCVVVVERAHGGELCGIVVDSVSQVIELGARDIEPPPSFGTQIRQHFLRGMGKAAAGFVLLLDLERVIAEVEATHVVTETQPEAVPALLGDAASSSPS